MRTSFLILFLLLAGTVLAQDANIIARECENAGSYDLQKKTECELHSYALTANYVNADINSKLMDAVLESTLSKIEIEDSRPIFTTVLSLTGVLLLFIAVHTGYTYIASANYPEKRTDAKRQIRNIVMIAVLMPILWLILLQTYELGDSISVLFGNKFLQDSDFFRLSSFTTEEEGAGGTYQSALERYGSLAGIGGAFQHSARSFVLTLYARHLVILFLIAISPLVLVLFYFQATRSYGMILAYLFLIELVIPGAYVLALKFAEIFGSAVASDPSMEGVKMLILSSAMFFAVGVHAILVLVAVMRAVLNTIFEKQLVVAS